MKLFMSIRQKQFHRLVYVALSRVIFNTLFNIIRVCRSRYVLQIILTKLKNNNNAHLSYTNCSLNTNTYVFKYLLLQKMDEKIKSMTNWKLKGNWIMHVWRNIVKRSALSLSKLNSSLQDDPSEEIQNKQVKQNNAERKRAMEK